MNCELYIFILLWLIPIDFKSDKGNPGMANPVLVSIIYVFCDFFRCCSIMNSEFDGFVLLFQSGKKFGVTDFVHAGECGDNPVSQV